MIQRVGPKSLGVLMLCNVAGMIDVVALPVWVGTLMQHYQFSAPQAGMSVTLFLLAVVVSSTIVAPRFDKIRPRTYAAAGFLLAAVGLYAASRLPVTSDSFVAIGVLHAVAGLGNGVALSVTHGSVGRTPNPHRLFGLCNVALGLAGIAFLGGVPVLVNATGPHALFQVMAALMLAAALLSAMAFPTLQRAARVESIKGRLPLAAWLSIGTVVLLALNQAMVFSFMERIGAARGFDPRYVQGVLIALGFVNLVPGALAALLQTRLSPVLVGMCGPAVQAVLALTLTHAQEFGPFAAASAVYVSVVIFTHTFMFGLLARLDQSGRAVAATPAMMMVGSCLGPLLGGAQVATFGFPGLGWAAALISVVGVAMMLKVRRLTGAEPLPATRATV